MTNKLQSKNIFIDTQAFMQQGLKFENKVLSRIKDLGKSKLINIYISDVILREVSSKISEKLSKAFKLKNDLLKELNYLESSAPKEQIEALNKLKESELINTGIARWDSFISESKTTILDPNKICNQELLSLYFDGNFPFSEGKKKDEFPDAISLLSLKSWVEENKKNIYVISNDKDLKGYCKNNNDFISLSHLSEFLDEYNIAEERLTIIVHQYIKKEMSWLIEAIKQDFLECGFVYLDNWGADAEVDAVKIIDLNVYEIDIIDIEEGRANINFRTNIVCSADISGYNYDNAIWDSEDKEFVFVERFDQNMIFDDVYDVTFEVYFDETDSNFTDIMGIQFDDSNDINLHYDDGYPYK